MKSKLRPVLSLLVMGALLNALGLLPAKAADASAPESKAAPAPATSLPQPGQSVTLPLAGNVSLDLVAIKSGTFLMGSPEAEEGRYPDEGPQHKVTLTKDFWLGKYPVTQAQYVALIGTNPSTFNTDGNLPVESVSWEDATAFCQALTEQEKTAGRLPAGYAYQLPTEAQWEYACRAGTTTPYPGDLDETTWYDKNSNGTTHPVGQKKPNAWGLYDMNGNVRQWCADKYGPYPSDPVTDPPGAKGSYWVIRGGAWYLDARYSRSASRYSAVTGHAGGTSGIFRVSYLGFRVALAPKLAN